MNSSIYKVGIIGLGQIAYSIDDDSSRDIIWSHALAYTTHPGTEIVAVCDIDSNRIDGFKDKYGDLNEYTEYKDMLIEEDLDIISICAPT
ncbi:gfo/Idh/MocA family oxidoreductase, partial [Candidatus Marinimicrobia bacterium MT.SAG.3]